MNPGRRAGVCVHVTSLPGRHGIGEIGSAARHFVDKLARMRLAVWQFLPLGPTAYGDSPYQPLSTFAGNEMLIDIGDLVDLHLLDETEATSLAELPDEYVDYGALIPLKWRLLRLAASRFNTTALHDDFARFLDRHDDRWLHDYALYRLLKSQHGERPWPKWAPEFAQRDAATLRQFETRHGAEIRALKVIQFLFFRQWAALHRHAQTRGITLFGDMPIYIALDSADAWANRSILALAADGRPTAVAGVPPDYFSADGQLWGNPLYDWDRHAANGYSWWIDRLMAALDLVDVVRIDHFRGFESYWAVPADEDTARNGRWERGPGDAIFDAFRAKLGYLPIIAEDLGVITPEVDALRDRQRLPGMRVLQFDVMEPGFDPSDIVENCVCYTGTHDNDTTLGWFRGGPGDTRSVDEVETARHAALAVTGGGAETLHTDFVRVAFSTAANLAMAPLQDYLGLGSEARMNTPGVAGGNWRWRVLDSQLSPDFCDNVASLVEEANRDGPAG